MKYVGVITVTFEDENDNRAVTRAKELASWMPDNLADAYGDDSLKVIEVHVTLVDNANV